MRNSHFLVQIPSSLRLIAVFMLCSTILISQTKVEFESSLQECDDTIKIHETENNLDSIAKYRKVKFNIYHSYSVSHYQKQEYLEAEKICLEAKENIQSTFGKDSTEYTRVLNTLGTVYNTIGEYKKCRKVYLEAKKIKEKKGENDLQYAKILTNLGRLLTRLNDFSEAEKCLNQAAILKSKLKGEDSPDYARTLYNLALNQNKTGQVNQSHQTIDKAIAIFAQKNKTSLLRIAKQGKATFLQENNSLEEAINISNEIKKMYEQEGETNHENFGLFLHSLSLLKFQQAKYDEALDLATQSISIIKEVLGTEHEYYAKGIRTIANIKLSKGDLNNLEADYILASKIIQTKYGKNHIEYFESEFDYLNFLTAKKDLNSAKKVIKKIDPIIKKHVKKASKYLSNKELGALSDLYKDYFQNLLNNLKNNPNDTELSALAFDNSLFFKGFILESLINIRNAIKNSTKITELSEDLVELNLKLENEYNSLERNDAKIAELEGKIENMDTQLSRALGSIKTEEQDLNWEDLQYSLNDEEAIIDFVRITNDEGSSYAAFIMNSLSDQPQFKILFEEEKITSVFQGKVDKSLDFINQLYTSDSRGIVADKEVPNLYELIWQPIEEQLEDVEKVFYISDGILHGVSLEAIPIDDEISLKDNYQFLRLTNFKNLNVEDFDFKNYSNQSLILGGIEYGAPSASGTKRSKQSTNWNYLPQTLKEAEAINKLLGEAGYENKLLKEQAAEESNLQSELKKENEYRILHFATHGFFNKSNLLDVETKVSQTDSREILTNTGLVLSNANLDQSKEDNILTSYEISQLNLANTELSVLSACETGLGNVEENEGVFGLQRAFKIAGAKYIIMSLWEVDDRATNEFMKHFYNLYINEKVEIVTAFNQTQQAMKDRFFDVDKWAGFVLVN